MDSRNSPPHGVPLGERSREVFRHLVEAFLASGEPVGAVLEVVGGRAADLGIAEGDKVSWPGRQ